MATKTTKTTKATSTTKANKQTSKPRSPAFQAGLAMRKKVLGDDYVERSFKNADSSTTSTRHLRRGQRPLKAAPRR